MRALSSLGWVVLAVLSLAGCGGGGGGGESPPPPEPVVVSGTVAAQNGGTVELLRADGAAAPQAVLASTTVVLGRYRFDLTALGLKPASDLMLRATSADGVPVRALAASTQVDVAAGTEGFVQWLQQRIAATAGASLSGLTALEAAGLQGSAHVLALLEDTGASIGTSSAIDAQRERLARHPRFGGALAAALSPSTALAGPGDLLDLVPLADGWRWVYRSGGSVGAPAALSTADVRATATAGRFEVLHSDGPPETYLQRPDALVLDGAASLADDAEIGALIGEYPVLDFPPVPGRERTVKSGRGLALADQDGDGQPESMDFSIVRREGGAATTTLSLADGTTARAIEITDRAAITVRYSSGPVADLSVSAMTRFTPGIGPVWESVTSTGTIDGQIILNETEALALTSWFEPAVAITLPHRRVLFDAARGVAYASVPTGSAVQADRVVAIDLATRSVILASPSLGAGGDPDLLALGGDGQSLWVSLAGTGALARLALPSLALIEQFPLTQVGDLHAPWRAASLATTSAWPDGVAVALYDVNRASQGVGLYRAGLRLPQSAGCVWATWGDTCRVSFEPGSMRLFALDDNTTRNTLASFGIDPVLGATQIAWVESTDLARPGNGLAELGWVGTDLLLAPDGSLYRGGTLQRVIAPAGGAGCIALTRNPWFACREGVVAGEFALRELMTAGSTQSLVSTLRVPGGVADQARLVDLGSGRIGVSDVSSAGASAFDRLWLIEGGPY